MADASANKRRLQITSNSTSCFTSSIETPPSSKEIRSETVSYHHDLSCQPWATKEPSDLGDALLVNKSISKISPSLAFNSLNFTKALPTAIQTWCHISNEINRIKLLLDRALSKLASLNEALVRGGLMYVSWF